MTTPVSTTTRTVTIAGVGPVAVTYDDRGEGQPFVLLHGGAGPFSMGPFASALSGRDRTRVLTPTHPGFGGTPRPDGLVNVAGLAAAYLELINTLDLEDVTVIGNSVGGWITAELALLDSPRVSGIVLLDPVGIEVLDHPVADVTRLSVPEIQALSFHDPAPFRIDPTSLSDAMKAIFAQNAAALAVYAGPPPSTDPTLLKRLHGIKIPALVLWGASDQIVDPEYGRVFAEAIHWARFQVLPGTGHMPQLETPDLVLNAIWDAGDAPYQGRYTR